MAQNGKALDFFNAKKIQIDQMLARLQLLSANHFDAPEPEDVNWGHVGELFFCAEQLWTLLEAIDPDFEDFDYKNKLEFPARPKSER